MKFTNNTEDKCESFSHDIFPGDAFAFDSRNRLVLMGGNGKTGMVHIDKPDKVLFSRDLNSPFKWHVNNYEWDMFNSKESERYLQTRNKIIEIIDVKNLETVQVLEGHARALNQAKWAPMKRNVVASTSSDSFIMLWDVGRTSAPEIKIKSFGQVDCLSWSKSKENIFASTFNNDIKIFDIRMTNRAIRYLRNAHSKKIFSLDWCNSPGEEILLSSSKDKNIKLWNLNMINERLMEKLNQDFPCWKAKFSPISLCFGVIPTCQSNFLNDNFMQQNIRNHLNKEEMLKNETFLMTYQITALNEAKANKILSSQLDMIVDFDFNIYEDLMSIITWSRDHILRIFSLNLQQFSFKSETERNFKIKSEDELGLQSLNKQHLSALHHTTNTTNSSRKSSFSENLIGTSPSNFTSNFNVLNQYLNNDRDSSFNLAETAIFNDFTRPNSQNLIKSQSSSILPHEFLRKYPKSFGGKFSGLPENFIVFTSEPISTTTKSKDSDYGISSLKRNRVSGNNSGKGKNSNSKSGHKLYQTTVYKFEITNLLTIRRDLAEKYEIKSENFEKLCNQNIQMAAQVGRYDIMKIWQILKFVTYTGSYETTFLGFGQPWPFSIFGRTLINNVIDNYVTMNDVQSAAMIISKLKLYDLNMNIDDHCSNLDSQEKSKKNSISSSFDDDKNSSVFDNSEISENDISDKMRISERKIGLLDPDRLKDFDFILKKYCNILHKWGLFNKRIEMLEFLSEKPQNMDEKFECFKRCNKCANLFNGSKCGPCNSNLKCSLCELPVNGLILYCSACGCGGHYDHLIEWFDRHDDCPSACGCRCIDFI